MTEESPAQAAILSPRLTLDIPATDSGFSSLQSSQRSSPTDMLDSNSTTPTDTHTTATNDSNIITTTTSCPSLALPPHKQQPQLNVRFAPLPQLAPRKRRSAAPLGMAARSQLVQRRRRNQHHHNHYYEAEPDPEHQYVASNPMWTEEELAEARARQVAATTARKKKTDEEMAIPGNEMEDDPFVMLGKLVKDASKHFWKKVAKKDKKEQAKRKAMDGESEKVDKAQCQRLVSEKAGDTDSDEGQGGSDSSDSVEEGPDRATTTRASVSSDLDNPPQVPPKDSLPCEIREEIPVAVDEPALFQDELPQRSTELPSPPSTAPESDRSGASTIPSSTPQTKPSPSRPVPPCPATPVDDSTP